jgi:hypothetical protein
MRSASSFAGIATTTKPWFITLCVRCIKTSVQDTHHMKTDFPKSHDTEAGSTIELALNGLTLRQTFNQLRQIVGVLLFRRLNVFNHSPGR